MELATRTNRNRGQVTGQPNRFLAGHAGVSGRMKGYWEGKKRPNLSADKNPAWQGGTDNYCKRQAKLRDDYTCQNCGYREPEIMEVDHIKPKSEFPELRHVLDNLVTLCPNCHRRKTIREHKARKPWNKKAA